MSTLFLHWHFLQKVIKLLKTKNLKPATYEVVVLGDGGAIKLKNQNLPFFELPGTTKK